MRSPLAKTLKKYAIAVAIGLILAYIYVAARIDLNNVEAVAKVDLYLILCDAFSIPGLLLLLSGLMMTLGNHGALDGVGYVAVNAFKMLIPGGALKAERYKEYLERKRANRIRGYGFLFVTAIAFLAIAAVFMVLFYSLYQK